jgi:dimeric dUTPase (all-alpha-NTP-PPase superfamily)
MDFHNMVRSIDSTTLPSSEILLRDLRSKLPRVYTEKDMDAFADAFIYVLYLGIKLNYAPMMLYLPARPKVSESLVVQFQQLNISIATREKREDWFHELFSLFTGMASLLSLSWNDIEKRIIAYSEKN